MNFFKYTNSDIIIRKCNSLDIHAIHKIYMTETFSGHEHEPDKYSLNDFLCCCQDNKTIFLVLETNSKIIGFLLAYKLPNWCYLDIICISTSFRKKGYAKLLLNQLSLIEPCVEFCVYEKDILLLNISERYGDCNTVSTKWFKLKDSI